ncbi:MAG: hypothetical protein V3S27_03345 [Kiloniellales bacterium]
MRIAKAVILSLGLAILSTAPAAAQRCRAPAQAPQITIEAAPGKLSFDHRLDDQALKKLVHKLERNMHLTQGQPLGLTTGPVSARYRTRVQIRKRQHSGFCVRPVAVEVRVGFETLTVYLDRKYQKGSCEYEAILAHEMEHVRRNRDAVKRYLPQLRRQLAQMLRAKPTMQVLGVERQARDAYLLYIKQRLGPSLRAITAARDRSNDAIDTPESYRAIADKCENW